MPQMRSQATSIRSSASDPLARRLRLGEHRREAFGIEIPLIEQTDGVLDDGRNDPRLRHDAPHRADGAAARPPAISRISSSSRAAPASASRRSDIGVEPACAAWPRKVTRWRSTPNVPSTAPRGRAMDSSTGPCSMCSSRYAAAVSSPAAAPACGRARRRDARARPGARHRRDRGAAAGRPGRASSRRRRSSRAGCGRSARPPRRPSRRAGSSPGLASSATGAAPRGRRPTFRQPSSHPPFGTESMWPPMRTARLGFTRERGPLVARRVDLHLDRELGELISHPRSRRAPTCPVQQTRCAPSASPVSSRRSRSSATVRDGSSATRRAQSIGEVESAPMGRGSRPIKRWKNDRQRKKKARAKQKARPPASS